MTLLYFLIFSFRCYLMIERELKMLYMTHTIRSQKLSLINVQILFSSHCSVRSQTGTKTKRLISNVQNFKVVAPLVKHKKYEFLHFPLVIFIFIPQPKLRIKVSVSSQLPLDSYLCFANIHPNDLPRRFVFVLELNVAGAIQILRSSKR